MEELLLPETAEQVQKELLEAIQDQEAIMLEKKGL